MSHWKFCLTEGDYSWESNIKLEKALSFKDKRGKEWLHISEAGVITVRKNYAWDGCTPKLRIFDWFYIGTPDGTMTKKTGKPKTYYASLIHDALYQFIDEVEMPFTRKQMDRMFLQILSVNEYSLAHIYYGGVRVAGGLYRQLRRMIVT